MIEHINYFDNDEKNMSFKFEDNNVLVKYNEIWNKLKTTLNIKLHSKPVYDEKYIKTKVKTFNGVVNTVVSDDKESIHYICIAAINIDFVMKIYKKTILRFI